MGTDPIIAPQSDTRRYEAIVRISEAIAACREPEQLATTLADEIGKFLNFDHLYLVVLKESSKEIEYLLWGKSPIPSPDLPMEELPTWSAINSRDPQHTPDWNTEERFPRFKEYAKKIKLGSSIRVPLVTPHRRLGVFGIIRDLVNPFSDEEIDLLRLIGRWYWRPRRDLNPCYRRERATPWRICKNLEGAGGAVRTSKTQLGVAGTAYRYMIVT